MILLCGIRKFTLFPLWLFSSILLIDSTSPWHDFVLVVAFCECMHVPVGTQYFLGKINVCSGFVYSVLPSNSKMLQHCKVFESTFLIKVLVINGNCCLQCEFQL